MPNVASLLKQEMARVARKEVRRETAAIKKASAGYRSEIASLKRRVAETERASSVPVREAPRRPQQPRQTTSPSQKQFGSARRAWPGTANVSACRPGIWACFSAYPLRRSTTGRGESSAAPQGSADARRPEDGREERNDGTS